MITISISILLVISYTLPTQIIIAGVSPMTFASSTERARQRLKAAHSIYMDCAATTPLDSQILEALTAALSDRTLGNPHAKHHSYGAASDMAIHAARRQIALSINCGPEELIFTSGATEANNLVLKGISQHLKSIGKTHILTSAVEHQSILQPLFDLEGEGISVSVLPVKPCGMLEASIINAALREDTGLVSVQTVNNETGTIQPLIEIGEMLADRGILFHSDAAQALGKVILDLERARLDFASFSAHKAYGPQGIGALYVKASRLELLSPLLSGGGQQFGIRSGTLPVALCIGFGATCRALIDDRERLQALRERLLEQIAHLDPVVYGHSHPQWNAPGILSLRFPGIDNDTLVMALPRLAFGVGSACSRTGNRESHVIKAITGSEKAAKECIRISFGRITTEDDIDQCADQLTEAITNIRQLQGVSAR